MAETKQQQEIKKILEQLEGGVKELFESDRYKEFLCTMAKFHDYSLNNTLLIAMQRPEATLVAGFTTWKNSFKRYVKKGEKGIRILAPAPYKVRQLRTKIDPETHMPVLDQNKNPVKEEVEIKIPAFKIAHVFDVSQTEGEEIPMLGVDELSGNIEGYEYLYEALKRSCPVPITLENITGGAKGYYHPTENRIALKEGMSEIQNVKTLIHEMAHQKLHADKEKNKELHIDRNTKEVEAESVAYVICQHYGIDTSEYSFPYLVGWSSGREVPELRGALERIRKAAGEMIQEIDEHRKEIEEEHDMKAELEKTMETEPEKEIVGYVEYASGEQFEYTDKDAYIRCIREELEYSSTSGFRYFTLSKDPELQKAIDNEVYNVFGLENPHELSYYQRQNMVEKPNITFYVAECMEFVSLGEYKEGLTLHEAMDIYEKIPAERLNGGKGIGFDLQDDSDYAGRFDLMQQGKILEEDIYQIKHYRESSLVRKAIADCKKEMEERGYLQEKEPNTAAYKVGEEHYLWMHRTEEGGWDYSLYDKIYDEIASGQYGNEETPLLLARKAILDEQGFRTANTFAIDEELLNNKVRFHEAKKLYDAGYVLDDGVQRGLVGVRMEEAFSVAYLNETDFTEPQLEKIRLAAERDVCVDHLMNPEFSPRHMDFLIAQMERGCDVRHFMLGNKSVSLIERPLSDEEIKDIERQILYDVTPRMLYTTEQWREIATSMQKKLDISLIANPDLTAEQMREIRLGLQKGLNVQVYADANMSAEGMKESRRQLEHEKKLGTAEKDQLSFSMCQPKKSLLGNLRQKKLQVSKQENQQVTGREDRFK